MAGYVDSAQNISTPIYGTSGTGAGGTAFNIGGINLGTQYPSAATAGGSVPAGLGGIPTMDLLIGGVAILALVLAIAWKR